MIIRGTLERGDRLDEGTTWLSFFAKSCTVSTNLFYFCEKYIFTKVNFENRRQKKYKLAIIYYKNFQRYVKLVY